MKFLESLIGMGTLSQERVGPYRVRNFVVKASLIKNNHKMIVRPFANSIPCFEVESQK
jgi:hypothetical protein